MSATEYWSQAHRELGGAQGTPCIHEAGKAAIYCPTCTNRVASIIEREKALDAEANRLDNVAEELASAEENLESWSNRLYDIEYDLKIREQEAERKESFLKRVFRKNR